MAKSILDASALLAALYDEPGRAQVQEVLGEGAAMSTVNVAEVAAHLRARDWTSGEVKDVFDDLGIHVQPFDRATALLSGSYRPRTRHLGLGVGARACLATARRLRLPALTADPVWDRVKLRGVKVVLIR